MSRSSYTAIVLSWDIELARRWRRTVIETWDNAAMNDKKGVCVRGYEDTTIPRMPMSATGGAEQEGDFDKWEMRRQPVISKA